MLAASVLVTGAVGVKSAGGTTMFGEVLGQTGGNVRFAYRTPEWVTLREGFVATEPPGRTHAVRLSGGKYSVSVPGCEPTQAVIGCGKRGSYEVFATYNGQLCSTTGIVNLVEGMPPLLIEYPNPRQEGKTTALECTPPPRPHKRKRK